MTSHGCSIWMLLGILTGCAAYAQDETAHIMHGSSAEMGLLIEMVKAGGLPAVLGVIGWLFGRGGLPVTIQLTDNDRNLIRGMMKSDGKKDGH